MDINRFTEKSREALATAQGLAAQYGHQEVDAEHLALALVNQEDGFVPRVLERAGVAPKALVTALEAVLKKRPSVRGPGAEMGTITISQRVAKAIANAEALGDFSALASRGRRAIYIHLKDNDDRYLSSFANDACSAISAAYALRTR